MASIASITEFPVKNDYNAIIGLEFSNLKDRIAKTETLKREMLRKRKLDKRDFRISYKDNGMLYCEYWDKSIYY